MTTNVDITRDARPMPTNAIDPDAPVPPSVKAAADRAAAIHAQAYPKTAADPSVSEVSPVDAPNPPAPDKTPEPVTVPVTPAPAASAPPSDDDDNVSPEQLKHRYLSMKGRWQASQKQLGIAQEQLSQLGDELVRTHSLMSARPAEPPHQAPMTSSMLTKEDVNNYGDDLIDMTKRAAMEAVKPALDALTQENQQLKQRVNKTVQATVFTELEREVPNWREINGNDRFKAWVRLPDIYSGSVRLNMLNKAFAAADAPRVIAFFKGFINDEVATGNLVMPTPSPAAASAPAYREPAVRLDTLTAPGRAKPATGDANVPVDKPVFTRADVSAFYRRVASNYYAGNEAQKRADEARLFDAQRDGRIRG